MSWKYVTIRRNELYREVWQEPVDTVAKRYGVSGVALGKICRKLTVPVPGRGYWAKLAAGQTPPRRALPQLSAKGRTEHTLRGKDDALERVGMREESVQELAAAKKKPARIAVPDAADQVHALVANTVRAKTIDALWEIVLGDGAGFPEALRYFEPDDDLRRGFPRSSLTALLHERFPVEKIEAAVAAATHWNKHTGERLLRLTPTEHRPRVARVLAKALTYQVHTVIDILKAFGRELADVLVEEAKVPERRENWLVAQAVWEVAPEIARDLARHEYALGKIDPWITSMPEAHLGELVAVVEEHPSQPVPDSLRFWLSRRLVEVGPNAERVWALLQRAGWPTCLEPSRPT